MGKKELIYKCLNDINLINTTSYNLLGFKDDTSINYAINHVCKESHNALNFKHLKEDLGNVLLIQAYNYLLQLNYNKLNNDDIINLNTILKHNKFYTFNDIKTFLKYKYNI